MAAARVPAPKIEAAQLRHWKLIEQFQRVLDEVSPQHPPHRSEHDPRRTLHQRDYFSLFLLGLFNPVITSMRGLCQASRLQRTQRFLGILPVSLGSFSEAQSLFDARLLQAVLERLVADLPAEPGPGGVDLSALRVVDSTLWYVLPRMDWATWRSQYKDQRAVRLHIKYRLADGLPAGGLPSNGVLCERKALRHQLKAGEFYIGDRNYGMNYRYLEELESAGCGFLMRLRQNHVKVETLQELPLSQGDIQVGVCRDELVMLGERALCKRGPFRLVVVDRPDMEEPVWLVSNQTAQQLSAGELAGLYRRRWEVEGFFRWLKCLLPCRHWFAESENGVAIQIYAALICALLLTRRLGRRPSKRMLEMLAFHQMQTASEEELAEALRLEVQRATRVRKPRYGSLQNWKPSR